MDPHVKHEDDGEGGGEDDGKTNATTIPLLRGVPVRRGVARANTQVCPYIIRSSLNGHYEQSEIIHFCRGEPVCSPE